MGIDNIIKELEITENFDKWISDLCDANNIPYCNWDDKYDQILHLPYEEIVTLSPEECFTYATLMVNYSSYLQKQTDRCKSITTYVTALIDRELSKVWSNYDKYMPAEIKRQAIINDNSYLTMLEKCKIRLSTYENVLSTSISDIKRRSSIFQDFGKRKTWN